MKPFTGQGSLKNKLSGRAVRTACAVALCALLGLGGFYGWQYYEYRQSADYAFSRLKQSLSPVQTDQLAGIVDFNAIVGDLASATVRTFPFFKKGNDQEWEIKRILQNALLQRFLAKERQKNKSMGKTGMEEQLDAPFVLMPDDFMTQFVQHMSLHSESPTSALVSTSISHPQLDKKFTLLFRMQKGQDGWRVDHMINAPEVASQLRDELVARKALRDKKTIEKNAAASARMNGILPIQGCQANAGLLSDGRTLMLVLHVLSRNRSDVQVNNMTIDASVKGAGGTVLQRFLNAATPVAPGEDFDHRWSIELDALSPEGRRVAQAGRLVCNARWRSMGLNSGQVLHATDNPDPGATCEKHGHEHPTGLCLLPLFNE